MDTNYQPSLNGCFIKHIKLKVCYLDMEEYRPMKPSLKDDTKQQIQMFMDTFRWEQDYYHRNRLDPGTPVGSKRYNRYENGKKVYYTAEQFKQKVIEYAKTLGVEL